MFFTYVTVAPRHRPTGIDLDRVLRKRYKTNEMHLLNFNKKSSMFGKRLTKLAKCVKITITIIVFSVIN